jgi:hypothetical protein
MDIGIDLIFSLDGIAVPPTKRDTHAGSQTDCGVGLQGGTLGNDKLKCETGHGRPGERWAAVGCASPHGEERGEDVEGRATDGRPRSSGAEDDDAVSGPGPRGRSRSMLEGRWVIMAKREVTLIEVSAGLVVGLLAV